MIRQLFLISLTLVLTACPVEFYEKVDGFLKRDITPPVLTSFELRDNRWLSFRFSEPCRIRDLHAGEWFVPHEDYMTEHHIAEMMEPISPGEEYALKLMVEDRAGNTSRWHSTITGINLSVPDTLITEVSAAGTITSPDRIELTFMSDGTTDGLCVMDGAIGEEKHRFYLPSLEVKRNDIAVIWWDRKPQKDQTVIRDMNRTYTFFAGSGDTLSSTNGSVILYSHTNGDGVVMDAFLYNKSDNTLADGFGNSRSRNTYLRMEKMEEWNDGTVESDRITSSRVFSRYFPYEDTNNRRDWYISAPRESSFGWPNTNIEFTEK